MPRLQKVIADANPSLVLSTGLLHDQALEVFEQIPELSRLIWLDTDRPNDDSTPIWRDPRADASTLAFLQYTSGSTASPKGVMVSHGNLLHNSAFIAKSFETRAGGQGVFWLPLYHDMGLIGGMLQTVHAGGTSTFMSPVEFLHRPQRWLEVISQTRATVSGGPDFAYDLCVRRVSPEARAELDLSCWEVAFSGAEPVRSETIERFIEAFAPCGFRREAFYPCYGLAEATLMVTGGLRAEPPQVVRVRREALAVHRVVTAEPDEGDSCEFVGCGVSPSDQRLAIVDPKTLQACPSDRIGEIWVSGPSVAQGYYDAPAKSESTFRGRIADDGELPYLRTGDLGFIRHGMLFVTGRLKDLIIIRGRNYYPQDIEQSVERSHPCLRPGASAAFTVDVENLPQLVVAVELERHRRDLDDSEVVVAIRQTVAADHELDPYAVVLLKTATLPRTSSGKVQRHVCREDYLANRLRTVACWTSVALDDVEQRPVGLPCDDLSRTYPPREAVEAYLVGLLSKRLSVPVEELDVDKSFFDFGISSTQAVALTGKLEQWLGRPLSPIFFYNYPTIALLAEQLSCEKPADSAVQPRALLHEEDLQSRVLDEVKGLSDEEMMKFISDEVGKLQ